MLKQLLLKRQTYVTIETIGTCIPRLSLFLFVRPNKDNRFPSDWSHRLLQFIVSSRSVETFYVVLSLLLNTGLIYFMKPDNSFNLFQLSFVTSDIIFNLLKAENIWQKQNKQRVGIHFFLSIAPRHSYCYFGFRKLCLLGVFVKQKRPTQKSQ